MTKYLYNGIELPALPEWDKSKYPYAFIANTANQGYDLYVCSFKVDFEINYKYPGIPTSDIISGYALYAKSVNDTFFAQRYIRNENGTEWKLEYTYPEGGISNGMWVSGNSSDPNFCCWSNFDIYYSGYDRHGELANTLYLAASVDPNTTPQDFYITKNGVGQKQDLYLRVGGQWVKQDEYLI